MPSLTEFFSRNAHSHISLRHDDTGGLFLWDIQIKNATMSQNRGLAQTLHDCLFIYFISNSVPINWRF